MIPIGGHALAWRLRARDAASALLTLLFPPVCASCATAGVLLCARCAAGLAYLRPPLCPACGRELDRPAPRCYGCARRPLRLQQVRTAVYYEARAQKLVHQLKYRDGFALARPLAEVMGIAWEAWRPTADLLVPVPLHVARQRRRGYNQAELLAHHLGHVIGLPLDATALQRPRATRSQVGLSAGQRFSNVTGAFAAAGPRVAGRHVLLVDDVLTTGATLAAAAEALLAAGAAAVSGFCLARARQG